MSLSPPSHICDSSFRTSNKPLFQVHVVQFTPNGTLNALKCLVSRGMDLETLVQLIFFMERLFLPPQKKPEHGQTSSSMPIASLAAFVGSPASQRRRELRATANLDMPRKVMAGLMETMSDCCFTGLKETCSEYGFGPWSLFRSQEHSSKDSENS